MDDSLRIYLVVFIGIIFVVFLLLLFWFLIKNTAKQIIDQNDTKRKKLEEIRQEEELEKQQKFNNQEEIKLLTQKFMSANFINEICNDIMCIISDCLDELLSYKNAEEHIEFFNIDIFFKTTYYQSYTESHSYYCDSFSFTINKKGINWERMLQLNPNFHSSIDKTYNFNECQVPTLNANEEIAFVSALENLISKQLEVYSSDSIFTFIKTPVDIKNLHTTNYLSRLPAFTINIKNPNFKEIKPYF